MKIRNDFVTNSSSSSFVVSLIAVDEKSGQEVVLAKTEEMSGDYNGESYEFCGKRVPTTDPDDVRNLLLEHFRGHPIESRRKGTVTRLLNYMKSQGLAPEQVTHLAVVNHCDCGADCHLDIEYHIEEAWRGVPILKDATEEQLKALAREYHTDLESLKLYFEFVGGNNQCYTTNAYRIFAVDGNEVLIARRLQVFMDDTIQVLPVLKAENMESPTVIEETTPEEEVTLTTEYLEIPMGTTVIEKHQYSKGYNNRALNPHLVIPATVVKIESFAFEDRDELISVVIPGTVKIIEAHTFDSCKHLRLVTISKGVKKIAWFGFAFCKALPAIVIPGSVEEIGNAAFQHCNSLASLTIEDGVQYIGDSAFQGCTNLTSVFIPASVTKIKTGIFEGCTSLTTIYCEIAEKPKGWVNAWKKGCRAKVIWGYKPE